MCPAVGLCIEGLGQLRESSSFVVSVISQLKDRGMLSDDTCANQPGSDMWPLATYGLYAPRVRAPNSKSSQATLTEAGAHTSHPLKE